HGHDDDSAGAHDHHQYDDHDHHGRRFDDEHDDALPRPRLRGGRLPSEECPAADRLHCGHGVPRPPTPHHPGGEPDRARLGHEQREEGENAGAEGVEGGEAGRHACNDGDREGEPLQVLRGCARKHPSGRPESRRPAGGRSLASSGNAKAGMTRRTLSMRLWPIVLALPLAARASTGDLDPSFAAGGQVVTPILSSYDGAGALVVQPDGKLVAAGHAYNTNNTTFALVRYAADGSLHESLGAAGRGTT